MWPFSTKNITNPLPEDEQYVYIDMASANPVPWVHSPSATWTTVTTTTGSWANTVAAQTIEKEDISSICAIHNNMPEATFEDIMRISEKYDYKCFSEIYDAMCKQYSKEDIFEAII